MTREWRKTFSKMACGTTPSAHLAVLCYHGWLRVGTGLALLEGMTELEKRAEEIDVRELCAPDCFLTQAIRLIHGSQDRATSHLGTLRLFDRLPNEDREIEIYEGYEHGEAWPD